VNRTSRISEFYKLSLGERAEEVKKFAALTQDEVKVFQSSLTLEQADRMIENVVGMIPIPIGIATNFRINGKDYLIPMATVEPSVVAAASYGAKMARAKGGFTTSNTGSIMVGQIQLVNVEDASQAEKAILRAKDEILTIANQQRRTIQAQDLKVRTVKTSLGPMVLAELYVDCKDAMGSNSVDDMAEAVAPFIEKITGGKVLLRIVSNYAIERLVRAKAIIAKEAVGGSEVVEGILKAYALAEADIRRAATHNKGIMNGISAVALATCNETQGVEAGSHAYAARNGRYRPLTVWQKDENGDLVGTIELPMAIGIVGGAVSAHPTARVALKILGVKSATELGEVMAAVGLAQNLAALRALVSEGIQRGHMELHARNIAMMAGATGELIDKIAEQMVKERKIKPERAEQLLALYQK
jgi:hydroxymethylglutaryl-CoA reductase